MVNDNKINTLTDISGITFCSLYYAKIFYLKMLPILYIVLHHVIFNLQLPSHLKRDVLCCQILIY